MIFRQLFEPTSSTYCYLIACPATKEAMLIDSVREQVDDYLKLLNELNLHLKYAIDTHVHADHVTGMGLLHQKTGCDMILGEGAKVECATRYINDGEQLTLGQLQLKALHTPGHTDESYCYLINDRIFTGDTLLIGGSGRTDFQNGDAKVAYHSLFKKVLTLPEDYLVYPGHDYKGRTVSTIGEEKRTNPRLQVNNAEEYAAIMDNLNLAKPKLIDIAVPANLQCGLV